MEPPPGAPLFSETWALVTLPSSDRSMLAAGTRARSSASTVPTAVARFFRSMPVAWPLTTTSSRRKLSRTRTMRMVVWFEGTSTVSGLYPMLRTCRPTARSGTVTVNRPSGRAAAPSVVPTTRICALVNASPLTWSATTPEIVRVCSCGASAAAVDGTATASHPMLDATAARPWSVRMKLPRTGVERSQRGREGRAVEPSLVCAFYFALRMGSTIREG